MGLNISKGNMYEWVTHTWNTVKGACSHDCSYCYMKRWGKLKPARFDDKELNTDLGENNIIFVGSSNDLFADDIPMEWIHRTIEHCKKFELNKYLFQTKNPKKLYAYNVKFGLPKGSIICTTIETDLWFPSVMKNAPMTQIRAFYMAQLNNFDLYVTIEPIMRFNSIGFVELIKYINPIQVNIGADTGKNNLQEPNSSKIKKLIKELSKFTKVEQKSNLKRLLK